VRHDPGVNPSLQRIRYLLTRPGSRAAVWLMVAALLLASASRFGFHAHDDAGEGHSHHHAFPVLVDHTDGAPDRHGGDGDGNGDGTVATGVLHGHDLGTVATLTMAAATEIITPAPSASVLATAAPPPDSRPSAPPIRPPIA
jgi:hypothetical protein